MDAILRGRSEIAESRLAVAAVQIIERMRLRASHLDQLIEEDLEVGTQLHQIRSRPSGRSSDMMGLETILTQKSFQIGDERRREDIECWRDLTNVMRDFLNAWEGFSKNEAKNRFLNSLPTPPKEAKSESPPPDLSHYYHDFRNTYDPKQ